MKLYNNKITIRITSLPEEILLYTKLLAFPISGKLSFMPEN